MSEPAKDRLAYTPEEVARAHGDQPRRGWRIAELAATYGGGKTSWLEAIRNGKLVARRIGKRTLIVLQPDLDDFLERARTDRTNPPATGRAKATCA